MITCRYCGAPNPDEERRCRRCLHRLHLASARPAPDVYPVQTASSVRTPQPRQSPLVLEAAVGTQQSSGMPRAAKVIPMPVSAKPFAPVLRNTAVVPALARPKGLESVQIEFPLAAVSSPPGVKPRCGELGLTSAPVASPVHRLTALAIDLSLIVPAAGILLGVLFFYAPSFLFGRSPVPLLAGLPAALWLLYELACALAGEDTLGMQWTGLTLVDFDGRRPAPKQRLYRLAAACLSVGALGLGLVWALGDEESLTWHDHLTSSFPAVGLCATPRAEE